MKRWTLKSAKYEALKHKTSTEFKKSSGAYEWARVNNVLSEITTNMPRKRKVKKVMDVSKLYERRVDFQKDYNGAYKWAMRHKLLGKVCSHMKRGIYKSKWNLKNVKEIAKKYKNRTDFVRNDSGAYDWATRKGYLGYVCEHMPLNIKLERLSR